MLAIILSAGGRKEEIKFFWENVPQSDFQHLIETPSSITSIYRHPVILLQQSQNRTETWTRPVLLVAYGSDACQPRYSYASGYCTAVFDVLIVEYIPYYKMGTIRLGADPFSSSHAGEMHNSQDIIMHRDTAWC